MSDRSMPCRVCGKPFIPCGKSSKEIGAFNYMEVACSPECGQEYLNRVLEGRKVASKDKTDEVATSVQNKKSKRSTISTKIRDGIPEDFK